MISRDDRFSWEFPEGRVLHLVGPNSGQQFTLWNPCVLVCGLVVVIDMSIAYQAWLQSVTIFPQ